MEVLLAGNTGYVTETFIEESFPECDVVVLGNEMLKSNRKKNILSRPFIKDEKELKEIFETYEFERITINEQILKNAQNYPANFINASKSSLAFAHRNRY